MNSSGHVIWLFGLSGAGKSTLAAALHAKLVTAGWPNPLMLDGDRLRSGLCRGLGFSDSDRGENLRRAAEVALLGLESGQIVIASFITPLEDHRRMIRGLLGDSHLSMVYLAAPLDTCRRRDPKGLYAKAGTGQVLHISGVDSRFDDPLHAALRLDTSERGIDECAASLMEFVKQRLTEHGVKP